MQETVHNERERVRKESLPQSFFLLIMISSAFTVYENTSVGNNNSISNSIPIQSYSAYGQTVSFIDQQPVVSFGSGHTEYPVSWNILQINTGNTQITHTTTPFVTSGNSTISMNTFTHYRTSRINDSSQDSAQLIQCSNSTQSASVFFFHKYTLSSSLAWKNKHKYNQTYMIDFTIITPYCNTFQVGGNGVHNMTMINSTGIIPSSCVDLQIGGVNLYWMPDASLFHGGIIEQKDHHDVVVIPFGTVTLVSNETYSIDPDMEPAPMIGPGPVHKSGGGGGGGTSPTTTYPPTFSTLDMSGYNSCIENGSVCDQVTFHYEVTSETQCSEIQLMFCEIEVNGNRIILSENTFASQYEQGSKTFDVNNIGCFSGFAVAYYDRDTGHWVRAKTLGVPFNEYIHIHTGYDYPDAETGNINYIIRDSGAVAATITGNVFPSEPLKDGCHPALRLTEGVFSYNGTYIPQERSWSLSYVDKKIGGSTTFCKDSYYEPHSNNGGAYETVISGIMVAAAVALGFATFGGSDALAAILGLSAWAVSSIATSVGSDVSYSINSISCDVSGGVFGLPCRYGMTRTRYCGFNGTVNPYYYFTETPNLKLCGDNIPKTNIVNGKKYFITAYSFTEGFSVFNINEDGYSRILPSLYSSTVTSPVYLQAYEYST